MKRKMTKLLLVFALVLPLLSLNGCAPKEDGTKLLKEAGKQMEKVKSMRMNLGMNMKMNFVLDDSNLAMAMKIDGVVDMTNDPQAMHMKMAMEVNAMGQKETQEIEEYLVEEEGSFVQYISNDGVWSKSVLYDLSETNAMFSMDEKMINQLSARYVGSEKIDGKDNDKVEVSMNMKTLKKMLGEEYADLFGEIDIDNDTKITADFYIDKKSKRYTKISFDFGKLLDELLSSFMGSALLVNSELIIDTFDFEITFEDYDKVEAIEVPFSIKNGSIEENDNIMEGNITTQTHVWEDMDILMNGELITVGETTLQQLLDLGYQVQGEYENQLGGYNNAFLMMEKGEQIVYISLVNNSDKKRKIEKCVLDSIYIDQDCGNVEVKGIRVGSTIEEVKAIFGEANTMMEYEDSLHWDYEVEEDTCYRNLSITFINDAVSEISLNCYYYY